MFWNVPRRVIRASEGVTDRGPTNCVRTQVLKKHVFWMIFVLYDKPQNCQKTLSKRVCRALDPTVREHLSWRTQRCQREPPRCSKKEVSGLFLFRIKTKNVPEKDFKIGLPGSRPHRFGACSCAHLFCQNECFLRSYRRWT